MHIWNSVSWDSPDIGHTCLFPTARKLLLLRGFSFRSAILAVQHPSTKCRDDVETRVWGSLLFMFCSVKCLLSHDGMLNASIANCGPVVDQSSHSLFCKDMPHLSGPNSKVRHLRHLLWMSWRQLWQLRL